MLMKPSFSTFTDYDDCPKDNHGYHDGYSSPYEHLIFSSWVDKECADSNAHKSHIQSNSSMKRKFCKEFTREHSGNDYFGCIHEILCQEFPSAVKCIHDKRLSWMVN